MPTLVELLSSIDVLTLIAINSISFIITVTFTLLVVFLGMSSDRFNFKKRLIQMALMLISINAIISVVSFFIVGVVIYSNTLI